MSLAVEHPHRPAREVEVEVDRPQTERSHAADLFNMDAPPTKAPGRGEEASTFATTSSSIKPKRSSYDMHRQYQDAMDLHELTTPTSEQHVVGDQAPVLPQKSALRASRLLVGLKITASAEPLEFTQTHHEEYLSSEEDASSTSGDFSDFEYDSSSDDVPSPVLDCSKHVTARVVSVIYSGKPSVIDVPQVRRSISPSSIERPTSMGGLSDKASYITELKSRRTSISTVSSRSSRSLHPRPLPTRSSSMQPPSDAMKARLGFLRIDPYANGSSYSLSPSPEEPAESPETRTLEDERPKTPKSPGHMFRGVARAMSLMKKKSAPRLSQVYLAPNGEQSLQSMSPLRSPLSTTEELPEMRSMLEVTERHTPEPETEARATSVPVPTRPAPQPLLQPSVTHDEILRIAKRNEQKKLLSAPRAASDTLQSPITPTSPLTKEAGSSHSSKRMSSFGFGRRRMSIKIPGSK